MAQTVQMLSRARHKYAGRIFYEGERFDCEARHVPALIALQRAIVARDMQAEGAPEYRTREMKSRRRRKA